MPIEHNTLLSHVPRFLAIQARKRALRWLLRWERMQDIYTPVTLQVVQGCASSQGIRPACDPHTHRKVGVCLHGILCFLCNDADYTVLFIVKLQMSRNH